MFKFGAKFVRFLPLILFPLSIKIQECFFWGSKLQKNELKDRIFSALQISNNPCEDRHDYFQLKSIPAYAAAVYDGHGGWQVSELCKDKILIKLDLIIQKNKSSIKDIDQLIKTSMREVFLDIENQYETLARIGYRYGFGRMGRVGSCALICLVYNNKVYCANAGDSLGLLIEKTPKEMVYTQLNRELNANHKDQQQRLRKQYPNEEDIVICKRPDNTSCYVKGRLQPTRSIGDLRLKKKQFNNPANFTKEHDFQPPLSIFTGPYITAEPEIKVLDLKKSHKGIILASDGLWDKMQRQEVAQYFRSNKINQIPSLLISRCLEKSAEQTNSTVEKIKAIPTGKKRKIHDDITIVVLDLQNQWID